MEIFDFQILMIGVKFYIWHVQKLVIIASKKWKKTSVI